MQREMLKARYKRLLNGLDGDTRQTIKVLERRHAQRAKKTREQAINRLDNRLDNCGSSNSSNCHEHRKTSDELVE